jgi:hypothetical protein
VGRPEGAAERGEQVGGDEVGQREVLGQVVLDAEEVVVAGGADVGRLAAAEAGREPPGEGPRQRAA